MFLNLSIFINISLIIFVFHSVITMDKSRKITTTVRWVNTIFNTLISMIATLVTFWSLRSFGDYSITYNIFNMLLITLFIGMLSFIIFFIKYKEN